MTSYDLSVNMPSIPQSRGGLLNGFAGELGNQLDNRAAANAYNPMLDSLYGAKPAPGGFLARLFGGAQAAPAGGAAPGVGGIGSDAVASARMNAGAPQVPAGMPPRAAVEALLGNPQTRQFGTQLLAQAQAFGGPQASGGQVWGGGGWASPPQQVAYPPVANGYPPRPMPNPLRTAGAATPGRSGAADNIPVGQVVVQNGVRYRKFPDGSMRSM